MRYFEDFPVGAYMDCGSRFVSEEEIISFARQFDPQPFHIDPEFCKAAAHGQVIGSGLHMLGVCMRQVVDHVLRDSVSLSSPGSESIRFFKPMRPDRTFHVGLRVLDATPSRSKPDRGLVKFAFELFDENDGGAKLAEWVCLSFFGRADAPARGSCKSDLVSSCAFGKQ